MSDQDSLFENDSIEGGSSGNDVLENNISENNVSENNVSENNVSETDIPQNNVSEEGGERNVRPEVIGAEADAPSVARDGYTGTEGVPQTSHARFVPPQTATGARMRVVPVWSLVLTVVLCAVISLGGCFGGLLMASGRLPGFPDVPPAGGGSNHGGTDSDPAGESTAATDYFHENPEEVLDKSEPNDSIYGSAGEEAFAVSGVARKVSDAVVVIEARIKTTVYGQTTVKTSSGSGVVISADGYVLTCNHVVEGAEEVEVILNSGKCYSAGLVGSDAASDLAVLKVNPDSGSTLVYAEQGCSEDLVLGEQVVAIGNPLGSLGGTVTTGIVSSTEREIRTSDGAVMTLIQTDAAINSGNSGGGLFNLDGQLIGIVNAKYSASGVEGLAFAIPIDSAYTVQLDLIEYGYVRGVVDHGLEFLEITEGMLRDSYSGLYYAVRGITEAGLYVLASEYETSLENADLIRSVNGVAVSTQAEFDAVLEECQVGDALTVVVAKRQQKWAEETVELELREFVPDRLKGTLN